MRLPTHVAFASVFWFGWSSLFGWQPEGEAIALAAVGALLPEIDTPHSLLGSFTLPLSERIRARWGHRTLTHSLLGLLILAALTIPLALWQFRSWLALLLGFLSHLLLDMGTREGVRLLWPKGGRCVFPGKDSLRLDSKDYFQRRTETAIFSAFLLLGVTLWPLASMGLLGVMRYALADIEGTFQEWRILSSEWEVFLRGSFQDRITHEVFQAKLPIVDLEGEGYVVVHRGELRTVGKSPEHNLYPLRVHLVRGERVQDRVIQVDLAGRYLKELLPYPDLSLEHYLYGNLELDRPIEVPHYPDRFNPLQGSSTLKLKLARWEDLLPYQDVKVRSGTVIIRTRLREGEVLRTAHQGPHQGGPPTEPPSLVSPGLSSPEPIPLKFEVATIRDLLVKVGDQVEVGDLIGRRSTDRLNRLAIALQRARARYDAGLIPETELRAAEAQYREEVTLNEVRSPLPGTVRSIEIKEAKPGKVEVVVYLEPDPSLAALLHPGGSTGSPPKFLETPSTTPTSDTPVLTPLEECPPPLGFESAASAACEIAQVLDVVDGDTLDVLIGGRQERVRLIGVDTPETKHPRKPVECYGPEASQFTKETLEGRKVWLTYKPSERYDKYGRLLAYVWLNLDGDPELELFNEELVRGGYARVYPFFHFRYLDEFRSLEAWARKQGVGLWGECSFEPYGE